MIHKKAVILRAGDIARHELPWVQRLNPRSEFRGAPLSRIAGFERVGVSRGRIPPGGEAFAYHAHLREEEWIFIVSGKARLRVEGEQLELAAGDFAAFPAPQPPHLLTNPGGEDCVYLMGGERGASPDVLDYPDLGKRYVLVREATRTAFHELSPAEYPFGRADAKPPAPWRVMGMKGCGSAIAEAVLTLAEIPYERGARLRQRRGEGGPAREEPARAGADARRARRRRADRDRGDRAARRRAGAGRRAVAGGG
jgi:uncharacterized cupin superfamily protein